MLPVDKEGRQVHVRRVGKDGGKGGRGKGRGRGKKGDCRGKGEGGTCQNGRSGLIGCGRKLFVDKREGVWRDQPQW